MSSARPPIAHSNGPGQAVSSAASSLAGSLSDLALPVGQTRHLLMLSSQGDCMFRLDTQPGVAPLTRLDTLCHMVSSMNLYFSGPHDLTVLETNSATVAVVSRNGVLCVIVGTGRDDSHAGALKLRLLHHLFLRLFPGHIDDFIAREGAETARQLEEYTAQDIAQSGKEKVVRTHDKFSSFGTICKSILLAPRLDDLWLAPLSVEHSRRRSPLTITSYLLHNDGTVLLEYPPLELRSQVHPLARACSRSSRNVWSIVETAVARLKSDARRVQGHSRKDLGDDSSARMPPASKVDCVVSAVTPEISVMVAACDGAWDAFYFLVAFVETHHRSKGSDKASHYNTGGSGTPSRMSRRAFERSTRSISAAFPHSTVSFDVMLPGVLKALRLSPDQSGPGGMGSTPGPQQQTAALTPLTSGSMFHITMTPAGSATGMNTPGSLATPSALHLDLGRTGDTPAPAQPMTQQHVPGPPLHPRRPGRRRPVPHIHQASQAPVAGPAPISGYTSDGSQSSLPPPLSPARSATSWTSSLSDSSWTSVSTNPSTAVRDPSLPGKQRNEPRTPTPQRLT